MDEISRNTVKIIEIPIFRGARKDAIREIEGLRQAGRGGYACFANVHTVTTAAGHPGLRDALVRATFSFPDGLPLVWSAELYGHPAVERISGPDFMPEFIRSHPDETFGFIGGVAGQAEEIGRRFGVRTVAYCPPFRTFSPNGAAEDLENLRQTALTAGLPVPYYVWVCLGAPKQEEWMLANSTRFPDRFFFGVGAAIDFLSGTKSRSPVWVQRLGLEWFYRLLQEPRRLFGRYLTTNSRFIFRLTTDVVRVRLHGLKKS